MDPFTVIVMLAIHLLAGGGLLFLVWRLLPDAPGVSRWWLSGVMFGLAYLLRIFSSIQNVDLSSLLPDVLMLFAILLLIDGLTAFVGRVPMSRLVTVSLCAGLFAIEVVAAQLGGPPGRHITLDLEIAVLYGTAAWYMRREMARQHDSMRVPLRVLTLTVASLSVFMVARAAQIKVVGIDGIYNGLIARCFYIYSALVASLIPLTLLWLLFLELNRRLADLATSDPLTGLLNRAGLDAALKRHFGSRVHSPLCFILLDIDNFKLINDKYGHASGDTVLSQVGRVLNENLRPGDFIARVGGEEFLAGIADTSRETSVSLAERLNEEIARLTIRLPHTGVEIGCTVSVGLSLGCTAYDQWSLMYRQADQALYAAKAAGRNMVMVADQSVTQ